MQQQEVFCYSLRAQTALLHPVQTVVLLQFVHVSTESKTVKHHGCRSFVLASLIKNSKIGSLRASVATPRGL